MVRFFIDNQFSVVILAVQHLIARHSNCGLRKQNSYT